MTKGWRGYWLGVFLVALGLVAWSLWNGLDGVPSCLDGHCPDIGSREYEAGLVRRRQDAPLNAAKGVACWLGLSLGGAGVVLASRRLLRTIRQTDEVKR